MKPLSLVPTERAPIAVPQGPAVRRLSQSPVITHGDVAGYGAIFNAGLIFHDGRYHLFARAVREGYQRNTGVGPRFLDYISDIVVFESIDGLDYQFSGVLARAGDHGVHCYEDPRVHLVQLDGRDAFIMTYTNLPAPDSGMPWRIGAHLLAYGENGFSVDGESGRLLGPDGVENKDAVLVALSEGRVALVHRIHPDMQLAVFDHFEHLWDADADYWAEHMATLDSHIIIRPNPGALGVGAGPPPIATPAGLLLFFHERRADGVYTMNLALLDADTGRTLKVLDQALLEPELEWERIGDVDHVVFVQGAHLEADGDTVYLVYGAADRCIGAATASVSHLLELLAA
jgi:beta-1,2-mannobiose phosphorylase / 1,2-beta-oligomannan phosphorylase